jgi:hypothetical protein
VDLRDRVGQRLGGLAERAGRGRLHAGVPGRSGRAAGRVPLTERGRFRIAVMAILKDEAPNMAEWLCHHMAVGVEHFFLYDNGSTDDLHGVLKPYADHGIVTTVYFPMRGLQRDANNHVVRFFGSTTDWLAYVDIDEFLVPERDEQLGDILVRYGDAEQVLVARKEFCYGGHRTPPGGLVTEAFREFSVDVPRVGTSAILAKPIIRPVGTMRVGIHNATTVHGRTVNTAGQPTSEEATVIEDPSYANLQMNHYFTKSWQEFEAKRNRATTSTHSFQLPEVPFDIPAQVDHVIDPWLPRTKALMEEMEALPRSPSRYGSRLRLQGFPISDMFGQEATAIVTNEAAGVSEARKKRTARSLPMPGVRGGLARADDFEYQPRPGAFLASPHVAQEMAWLQAEVTWSMPAGQPPLQVEGGRADLDAEVPFVRFARPTGSLTIPAGGARLRCHALLFALGVEAPGASAGLRAAAPESVPPDGQQPPAQPPVPLEIGVELAAREAGEWQPAATFALPGSGTYLALVALEKRPRTIDAVRVALQGASGVLIYDLALLTFG